MVRPRLEGATLIVPWDAADLFRFWDDRIKTKLTLCEILKSVWATSPVHRSYCGTLCRREMAE